MKAAPTREELKEVRLNRYRKRAAAERAAAKKRKPAKRIILGGRSKPVNLAERTGTHSGQHIDRVRVAHKAKAKTRRRKSIARASRRRNR